jgi:hypothetical protein
LISQAVPPAISNNAVLITQGWAGRFATSMAGVVRMYDTFDICLYNGPSRDPW